MAQTSGAGKSEPAPGIVTVRNMGEPLRFTDVEPIGGFAAEAAQPGRTLKVMTRTALTSEDPLFHRLVENLSGVVRHMAGKAGTAVNLNRADTVLLVFKADKTAELWLDTAAVAMQCAVKRNLAAGSVLFESDIADVTGMSFPSVKLEPTDGVLCIFREGWRFALAFDFNPDGKLDVGAFNTMLGTLYRKLRYRHLYEALGNQPLFDQIVASGWFPFVEIVSGEFKELLQHKEAGFDLTEAENTLIGKFDEARLNKMFTRWMAKPHFASKEAVLKAAIDAYNRKDPVGVLKILLTEIEGILNDAYRADHGGQGAKLKALLQFAVASALNKAGQPDTLLFSAAFAKYLAAYTFANFDPVAQTGEAGSRHAVGHGAAKAESYTMPRALQAILTLDQLAFYT